MTFRTLPIGDTFAFQPASVSPSRVLKCWKISARKYAVVCQDGSVAVETITHWDTPVYQHGLTGCVYIQK